MKTIVLDPNWYTLPSLSSLRAFEATARTGSFAKAARALNVTQAAVAQQVRSLEADLGVSLARRAGRSISMTDAGAQLATHLSDGFATIASGIQELTATQASAPVQASVTTFIAQSVLLPRLHEFWKKHPDIQVSMMPSLEAVDIAALGFDLGIRATVNTPDWPGLDAEFLVESQLIVAGAPNIVHPDMPDISDLPWLFTQGIAYEEARLRTLGLDPAKIKTVELGSASYEISAAIQGLGLITTPELLVRDELSADRLRRVPTEGLKTLNYYAVTPKGPVRPQARVFIDWLKQVFSQ
ncbi:LysR substrate-binding domain-containing protein [Shimia sp.]|uniref:LysR substrate-binding domain-containing protein n=1 Tax=Shimia sp. TaxID=1954381 RepID=UPI0032983F63